MQREEDRVDGGEGSDGRGRALLRASLMSVSTSVTWKTETGRGRDGEMGKDRDRSKINGCTAVTHSRLALPAEYIDKVRQEQTA